MMDTNLIEQLMKLLTLHQVDSLEISDAEGTIKLTKTKHPMPAKELSPEQVIDKHLSDRKKNDPKAMEEMMKRADAWAETGSLLPKGVR